MAEFDIELRNALESTFREEWQELEAETDITPYEFPEGYEEKVLDKAYKALNNRKKALSVSRNGTDLEFHGRPRIRRTLLVAALIALLLFGTITAYALTHPEIIYNIKKTAVEWTFHFKQIDPDGATEKFVPVKPETPEGFEITEEETLQGLYCLTFENNEGKNIFYDQCEANNLGMTISGEGDKYLEIEIKGHKGLVYHEHSDWSIIWDNGYYLFEISGNVDYEVLLKMAESIE